MGAGAQVAAGGRWEARSRRSQAGSRSPAAGASRVGPEAPTAAVAAGADSSGQGREVGRLPRPGTGCAGQAVREAHPPWGGLEGSAPPAFPAPHLPPHVIQSAEPLCFLASEQCCGGAREPERSGHLPEAAQD